MAIDSDPSSQQLSIVLTCILSPVISCLFVTIRLWTRIFVTHTIGWDDYTALATWHFAVAYSVLVGLATNHGMGWHTADMTPDLKTVYSQWVFRASPIYVVTLLGYKLSILLLYLRLFGISTRFRFFTGAVMFFVFGYLFCNLMTQFFGCRPIAKYWTPSTPGHCIVLVKAAFANGSMNFFSDLFIFALPLPMVWQMKLSRRQKLDVTLVFMGGGIAFLVAAVRYGLLVHKLFYAVDKQWYAGKVTLWMILEINTGLICSCTPALKPFVNHFATLRKSNSSDMRQEGHVPRRVRELDDSLLFQVVTDFYDTDLMVDRQGCLAFTNHDSSALGSDAVPRTVLPLPLFDNIDNEPVYPV